MRGEVLWEGQSLRSTVPTVRRGWYSGGQEFCEKLSAFVLRGRAR